MTDEQEQYRPQFGIDPEFDKAEQARILKNIDVQIDGLKDQVERLEHLRYALSHRPTLEGLLRIMFGTKIVEVESDVPAIEYDDCKIDSQVIHGAKST